jgi:hypothetical protein
MTYQDTHQDTQILYPIDLLLTTAQAMALARFVKRLGWADFRANAVDDEEAEEIRAAVEALQKALAEAGFALR